jgi:hypothetical protein
VRIWLQPHSEFGCLRSLIRPFWTDLIVDVSFRWSTFADHSYSYAVLSPCNENAAPLTVTLGLSQLAWLLHSWMPLTAILQESADSLEQLMNFSALIHHLKERISWHLSVDFHGPPLTLPNNVTVFCAEALWAARSSWNYRSVLCELLWQDQDLLGMAGPLRNGKLLELFLKYGSKQAMGKCFGTSKACPQTNFHHQWVGFYDMYPPRWTCLDSRCNIIILGALAPRELSKLESHAWPIPTVLYKASLLKKDFIILSRTVSHHLIDMH